jgi:transcription initiation factor TFIIIB Brf1 subunit/transcription initiation factor TFIIB
MNANANANACTCKKRVFDAETGEEICQDCGQTFRYVLQDGTDYKYSPIKHDITKLAERDFNGKEIAHDYHRSLRIAQSLVGKKRDATARRRAEQFDLVDLIGQRLSLNNNVIRRAEQFINKCEAKKIGLWRRYRAQGITAVCLYLATKELGVPRHFKEYAKAALISEKTFRRFYRMVETEGLNTNPWGQKEYRHGISYLCNTLGFPQVERKALQLFDKTGMTITHGKNRSAVAAAYVFLACMYAEEEYYSTQKEIAKAAGTSYESLHKIAKLIEKELSNLSGTNEDGKLAPTKL